MGDITGIVVMYLIISAVLKWKFGISWGQSLFFALLGMIAVGMGLK